MVSRIIRLTLVRNWFGRMKDQPAQYKVWLPFLDRQLEYLLAERGHGEVDDDMKERLRDRAFALLDKNWGEILGTDMDLALRVYVTDDGKEYQVSLTVVSGRLLASCETEQFQDTMKKERDSLIEKYGFTVPEDKRIFRVAYEGMTAEMNAEKFKDFVQDLHRLQPWSQPIYEVFERE